MTEAFWNAQVRDNLDYLYNEAFPTGSIIGWGGTTGTIPTRWLQCDGSAINRTTYSALFTAIGTAYGTGDGSTTFNIPDGLGRMMLGAGTGSGLTVRARGDKSGTQTHAISLAEMPSHAHPGSTGSLGGDSTQLSFNGVPTYTNAYLDDGFDDANIGAFQNQGRYTDYFTCAGTIALTNGRLADQGSGGAHNNMLPFWVSYLIIKT
jgi:microcystin-dependent protein